MLSKTAATKISIATAFVLAVFKFTVGLYSGSLMIITSAVDSLLDIGSSSVNYFAIKLAEEPPDKGHPYGHSKYEPLAAFIQSMIIMASGVYILYQAYEKITGEETSIKLNLGILVMVISIIATFLLVLVLRSVAKRTKSPILKADALHYEIDLLTGGGVLFGLIIIKFFSFYIIDPIISVLIAIYIIYSALQLAKEVMADLLDEEIPEEEKQIIKDILEDYDEILHDYHNLRTRKAGASRFIDMHVTLCRRMTVEEAHEIADDIENRIKLTLEAADATIHIDPCSVKECNLCLEEFRVKLDDKLHEIKCKGDGPCH